MKCQPVDAAELAEALKTANASGAVIQVFVFTQQSVTETKDDGPTPHLAPVKSSILEAAPGPQQCPLGLRALAKRAGYAYSSYFRAAVSELVDAGLLVRITGGVRKAK
jgi:hypothetical protein